jgi:hypothetical protein
MPSFMDSFLGGESSQFVYDPVNCDDGNARHTPLICKILVATSKRI